MCSPIKLFGVVNIRDDALGWSRSTECLLDSPRSSRNVGRVSAKTSPESFRDLDPFPPASERSDQKLRGNGTDHSHLLGPLLRLLEACVHRDWEVGHWVGCNRRTEKSRPPNRPFNAERKQHPSGDRREYPELMSSSPCDLGTEATVDTLSIHLSHGAH